MLLLLLVAADAASDRSYLVLGPALSPSPRPKFPPVLSGSPALLLLPLTWGKAISADTPSLYCPGANASLGASLPLLRGSPAPKAAPGPTPPAPALPAWRRSGAPGGRLFLSGKRCRLVSQARLQLHLKCELRGAITSTSSFIEPAAPWVSPTAPAWP